MVQVLVLVKKYRMLLKSNFAKVYDDIGRNIGIQIFEISKKIEFKCLVPNSMRSQHVAIRKKEFVD